MVAAISHKSFVWLHCKSTIIFKICYLVPPALFNQCWQRLTRPTYEEILRKINFGHLCFSDPACVERTKYCKTLTKIVLSSNESDREALAPQQPLQPFEVLEDGSFSCSYCGKNYKLIGSLKKHLEKNHAILNAIVFKCETCGKTFETKCQETRHMKSHWFLSPSSNQCHLNGINI